jgi:uncharacterized damage-inducible protein DinB
MSAPDVATLSPYLRETIELLGSQDPLRVMAGTPSWITAKIEGCSHAMLTRPEGPERWSVREVVAHLADAEVAFGWRARVLLTADRPALTGFDESAWMTRFDCAHAELHEALAAFTALRAWNMRVWSCATDADLDRVGIHAERGPETFGFVRSLVAGHDLRHRRQIDRILQTSH